nr:Blood coagulation inhibitor domain containing protein [Haemonchus contortus]
MLPHLFLCIISFFPIVYPLNNFVDNYETLNYRVVNTVRRKRSSGYGEPLNLKFFAYNRTFHLILLPLDPLNDHFHPDHILDEDGRYEDIEPHKFLYEGFVKDDPGSKVYGSILDGVFEGHIRTGDGNSYSVDRAAKYFDYDSRPSHYHSILYRDDDINHRKMRVKRSASSADPSDVGLHSCGLDDRVKRDMERIQRAAEVPPDVYTNYVTMHGRSKRATRDSNGLYTVRTCSLYLQADHKLYEHIKRKEGNNDPIRTREEIVSLFYNHIKAVNEIYEGTNFNGIVTLVNYGNRVPTRVSQLTLAHEIGHNFGSPHDFPIECQPGLPDGNFIMFASATSGDKVNNAKFSPCSVANISSVLHVVLQSVPIDPTRHAGPVGALMKRNCFQERTSAFCGNQIHEPGEECDCGFSQADCDQMGDKCCTPHESARNGFSLSGGPCKRKAGAKCSPSEGYCCNSETCSLHQEFDYKICRHESECSETQWCNGLSAQCPPSPPKQDGLPCQDSTKVCSHGSCNGSICEYVGLKDCFLTEGRPEELCFLACIKDGKCTSSVNLPEFASNRTIFTEFVQQGRKGKSGLVLHPGSPCNNYKGYCDIFRKCRSVDANGPLARLKNLLFNKKTIETVTQWVQEKWWVVVFGALVILVLMALFIKCCAVHTPSTNPNKPPALNLYQTLTRPSTLIRQRRHRSRAALPGATSSSAAPRSSAPSAQQPSSSSRTRASAPPLPQAPPAPVIPTGSAPPVSTVLVVEPPPPYTAAADPGSALGGPRRGHRRNKRQASSDAAPKASKSRGAKTKGTKGK